MQMQWNLGHDEAQAAIDAIRAELARRNQAAVIAVADADGELVALLRLDGAPASSVAVAGNKACTAARLRRPSRVLGESLRARGADIAWYGDARFTGWSGGLPVIVNGNVVGAVAVSGLAEDEDVELAAFGAAAAAGAAAPGAATA
jgi:glc operon protein GlcG